ncbi:MAG: ATP-dependent DNA helicase RecG [Acidobacteriota bacterium]
MTVTRLEDRIDQLPGIGPKRAEQLAEKGIVLVEDLLWHLPTRYEERGGLRSLRDIREGEKVTVWGRILQSGIRKTRRRGFTIFSAVLDDGTGSVRLSFFNRPYLKGTLAQGTEGVFHGTITRDPVSRGLQLANPQFEVGATPTNDPGLVPVHGKLPGFTPRGLRKLLVELLEGLPDELPPSLPPGLEKRDGLPPRQQALRDVHFPPATVDTEAFLARATPAHQRFCQEELFQLQLSFALRRRNLGRRPSHRSYATSKEVGDRLRALLPFKLTAGQRTAFKNIVSDLQSDVPMARLLQGDVGCGKTIVALLAMLLAVESGYQAALMAPTELLAEQHARGFRELLGLEREVGLLTGRVTGKPRKALLGALERGDLGLLVGTHALIQDDVVFRDLALVIIDEQHRFGVGQRELLRQKGDSPDLLAMSATPIPRTLALSFHGDLDVAVIEDKPPGRKPPRTVLREPGARKKIHSFLADETAAGRQAYVVFPVIEEGESTELRTVHQGLAELEEALPKRTLGLVHGKMPAEEREVVMREFAAGRVDILVATTVIEVGIDVPNATVMIIEHAERFGLSQLHQLRGRVGRGREQSWCILLQGKRPTPEGQERLELMVSTNDGFELAEADMAMRGGGEFFGDRQSGLPDFRIADPLRDRGLVQQCRDDAKAYLETLGDADLADDPLVQAAARRFGAAVEKSASG